MEKGINETIEVLDAVKSVTGIIADVLEDGKVSLKDAGSAIKLVGSIGKIKKAVEGIKDVPAELMDLDEGEIGQLEDKLQEFVDLIDAFRK